MRAQLLYFAAVRELVGRSEEDVTLGEEVRTIRDLRQWLAARNPALGARLGSVRFALDEEFVDDAAALHEGAVVALIPPVAGG